MRGSQVKSDPCGRNNMCEGPEARKNVACCKKRQLLSVTGWWNMTEDWLASGLGRLDPGSLSNKELRLS